MNKKLEVYMTRNNWLIKMDFTPKSLVTISLYYQYSRIGYRMASFLDMPHIMSKVEGFSMNYTKSILGMKNYDCSDKLRLTLNRPSETKNLWVLHRKNLAKYKEHFGEVTWIYNKQNWKYEKWFKEGKFFEKDIDLDKLEYWILKETITKAIKIEIA